MASHSGEAPLMSLIINRLKGGKLFRRQGIKKGEFCREKGENVCQNFPRRFSAGGRTTRSVRR